MTREEEEGEYRIAAKKPRRNDLETEVNQFDFRGERMIETPVMVYEPDDSIVEGYFAERDGVSSSPFTNSIEQIPTNVCDSCNTLSDEVKILHISLSILEFTYYM